MSNCQTGADAIDTLIEGGHVVAVIAAGSSGLVGVVAYAWIIGDRNSAAHLFYEPCEQTPAETHWVAGLHSTLLDTHKLMPKKFVCTDYCDEREPDVPPWHVPSLWQVLLLSAGLPTQGVPTGRSGDVQRPVCGSHAVVFE